MSYKNSIIFFTLFYLTSFGCSSESSHVADKLIVEVIDSLKSIYAPDARIARIDIEPHYYNKKLIISGESSIEEFGEKLLSTLQKLGYVAIDSITRLPHPALGKKNWALINVSVANLRGAPGHSKELVTQALMGTPVKLLKKSGGWYLIQTPDQYLAWTNSASLFILDKDQLDAWNNSEKVIITKDYAIIRQSRKASSPAVSDIVLGGILEKTASWGSLTELKLPDGRIGFLSDIYSMDFKIWNETISPDPDMFILLGLEMLGRPYLWGGTSSKGMDCSGFVKTLYFSGGLILPRDASQQVLIGELINTKTDFSQLIKGDLLFFGRKGTDITNERITHVAMYIGDDKYIHASGRVKINSLNSEDENYSQYLIDIFVKAKRIIGVSAKNSAIPVPSHSWYN